MLIQLMIEIHQLRSERECNAGIEMSFQRRNCNLHGRKFSRKRYDGHTRRLFVKQHIGQRGRGRGNRNGQRPSATRRPFISAQQPS